MKLRSYQLAIAIAIAFGTLSLAFSPSKVHSKTPAKATDNAYYYWYTADEDTFQAYSNTATEIILLQTIYGAPVNQTSFGGTLVARGFSSNVYPHQIWPSVLLYAHF